ncbi:hypothetical protein [Congregibacter sp.]|jgi:hypothetical protein|uniref:hypothetical protein n=1 Tax=Congregibacter sp. TaxID=2744308 RepID=UPI0039E41AC9
MNINWEIVGSIAELTGSIGVILTLFYVALQIKQAALGMRIAARQEATRQYGEFASQVIQNKELAELFIAGNEGDQLDRVQKARYFTMMEMATWQFSSLFYQKTHQKLPPDEWHQTQMLIQRTCTSLGYRKWWSSNSYRYEPTFVEFIEEIQREAD